MVGKSLEARPDRLNAILQEAARLHAEDGRPHSCDKGPQADCRIGAVHAKDGADDDGESDAVLSAHLPGECDDHATDCESEEDDWDGFSGCEA